MLWQIAMLFHNFFLNLFGNDYKLFHFETLKKLYSKFR